MWNNSDDLMNAIETAHRKLQSGEANHQSVHAEARLFAGAVKLLALKLDHARLTGRLKEGSPALPGFGGVPATGQSQDTPDREDS